MNKKGQAVLSEYVMIFFVVIAAAVAITTFVQRSLESRIHSARDFMIDSVTNSSICDANCMQATGGNIGYEYEPYYSQVTSDVGQNEAKVDTATQGNAQVLGAIYTNSIDQNTSTNANSVQLPPLCTNGGC